MEAHSTETPRSGSVIKLPEPFSDERGYIQNLVFEPAGVAVIYSKAGRRRSSHYHKTDAHYLYVLQGRMHYWERPVGSDEKPEMRIIHTNEMVYTGPMVEHWTEFPQATHLVSISKLGRDHATHEADLVRVPWFE